MSFTEKDKDYFFGLLENILKCCYINTKTEPRSRARIRDDVARFMKQFNLLEERIKDE